jgi:flagellar hook assembly protein FlgD
VPASAILQPLNISIYDITGRLIETIQNGVSQPGLHTVTWEGRGLPSGVYFLRLKAGPVVKSRKMLLLK